jgi:hypothetical protein
MIYAELVKRLRSCAFTGVSNQQVVYVDKSALEQAAAAIEALTAKLAKMVEERDTLRLVIDANIEKHRSRAEAAETKLAKAVEALRYYAVEALPWDADDSLIARTTLAEIEGDKG